VVVVSHSPGFPYLTVLVLLPAGGALAVALLTRAHRHLVEGLGIAVSLATLGFAVGVAVLFHAGDAGYQFTSDHVWAQALGVHWFVGVDGISVFLVLLAAVLFPIVLAGARTRQDPRSFIAWMLLLEAACIGSFISLDLILFFFFFELTLVPAYFIISGWGYAHRAYAAIKFFVYTFLGSAFLLVGILAVAFIHQHQTGVLTFSLPALEHTHFSGTTEVLLFLAFTAAFAVKAPLFPFHTWSPDAYAEAPTGGSMILAAVLAKLGTYGIIRFDLNLFPQATRDLAPVILTLAVIGILYGAIVACAQRDLKRLVAYSSLAHIGFIVIGAFALTGEALSGAVLEMVNHGIYTAALFLLVAMIYRRAGTYDLRRLGGLQKKAPVLAGVFTLVMLATIGVPGLNGFVGEFLILSGTFLSRRWWAVVAVVGVVLAAVYMLWAYQQAFHGRKQDGPASDQAERAFPELTVKEGLVLAPLVLVIVFLGVYPKPVLDRITPSVDAVVAHVEASAHQQVPVLGRSPVLSAKVSIVAPHDASHRAAGR